MEQRRPRSPRVVVDVTREIIEESIRADSGHCMIADSIKVALPEVTRVSVDFQSIRFSDPKKGLRYIYLTPRIAQVPLLRFDEGIRFEPFRFLLRGGQVVAMAGRKVPRGKPTDESKDKYKASLAKAILVTREGSSRVPERVGGKAPPSSASKRRLFGLRGMGRPPELEGVPAEMLGVESE